MPTDILLVRHGQTKSNLSGYYMGWSNEDLSDIGLDQAQRISTRLSALPIASVYSSPLQRAYTTAKTIARPHGLEVKMLQDIVEINLGEWQGLQINEAKQKWPELWQTWHTDPSRMVFPGGESFKQIADRVSGAFNTILSENPNVKSIIVTHEIVIKIIMIQVLQASPGIYRQFEIGNASLSWVQARKDRVRVITVNDKSHLEG